MSLAAAAFGSETIPSQKAGEKCVWYGIRATHIMHVPSDGFTFRLSLNLRRIPAGSAAGLPLPRASKTPSGCKPVGRRTYLCSYDSSSWVTALIHVRTFRPRLPGSTACRLKLCQRGSGGRNLSRVQKKVSFPTSRNPVLRSQVEWSLEKCGRLDGDRSSSSSSKNIAASFFRRNEERNFYLAKKVLSSPLSPPPNPFVGISGACLSERVCPGRPLPLRSSVCGITKKRSLQRPIPSPHYYTPRFTPLFSSRLFFARKVWEGRGRHVSLSPALTAVSEGFGIAAAEIFLFSSCLLCPRSDKGGFLPPFFYPLSLSLSLSLSDGGSCIDCCKDTSNA